MADKKRQRVDYLFPPEGRSLKLFYQLDPATGKFSVFATQSKSSQMKQLRTNTPLINLVQAITDELNLLNADMQKNNVKFSSKEQEHFDKALLLLERIETQLHQVHGIGIHFTKQFFNDLVKFFNHQCDEFEKRSLHLDSSKKRKPIDVLNHETDKHHYTRTVGGILKHLFNNPEIKKELSLDFLKNLKHDVRELTITFMPAAKHQVKPR